MILLQLLLYVLVIIDLSVEYDDIPSVCTVHGLDTVFQIDDTESPVSQRHIVIHENTVTVRSPMGDLFTHLPDHLLPVIVSGSIVT